MPLRILVDLLGYTGLRGGTETYAREIVERLPHHLPDARFAALANRPGAGLVRAFFPGEVHVARAVGADRVTWAAGEVAWAARAARRARADVMWSPANFGPLTRTLPRVLTVHDVTYHEASGSAAQRLTAAITAWLMARSSRTADTVITGSAAAAAAIEARIGIPAARVAIIPHGTRPASPSEPGQALTAIALPRDRAVVLASGNRLAHKNFEGLVRALATIPAAQRPVAVITGGRGDDPLRPLVDSTGLSGDVILPGWVSDAQMDALYAAADLYVCPSLAEGFGLPVIDAMQHGCPVLANDIPVLREVGGAPAWFADARDPRTFGEAISAALGSDDRERRRAAGRAWAGRFTWDESARRTAEVLEATARMRRG